VRVERSIDASLHWRQVERDALHGRNRYCHEGHRLRPLAARAAADSGVQRRRSWPPRAAPRKRAISRGKGCGVHDARPLGSGMDSFAFFFGLAGTSTGTTGARPSPTSTGIGCWPWVQHGDHGAPSGGPLKTTQLAGEKGAGSGVRALWGQQWTRLAAGHGVAASRPTPTSVAGSIGGVVRSSR
jgi:hypothetical protein